MVRTMICDACHGEGRIASRPAETAEDGGARSAGESSRSRFRRGSQTASAFACPGAGTRARVGAPAGDLYVLVRVREDERFVREGDDLVTALDVAAPLAALGATLDVVTLQGVSSVQLPPGSQPGDVLTLKGQGCPRWAAAGAAICGWSSNVVIRAGSTSSTRAARAAARDAHAREHELAGVDVLKASPRAGQPGGVIRLAVRVCRARAELVLAELLELVPAGVEEVAVDEQTIEYAVYGAAGELPALPDLTAAAGGALVEISTSELPGTGTSAGSAFIIRAHRGPGRSSESAPRRRGGPCALLAARAGSLAAAEQASGRAGDRDRSRSGVRHRRARHDTPVLALMLDLVGREGSRSPLLDIGTGSGLLAIAGAGLGFSPVLAVDHDREASLPRRRTRPQTASRSRSASSTCAWTRFHGPSAGRMAWAGWSLSRTCCARCCWNWRAALPGRPSHLVLGGLLRERRRRWPAPLASDTVCASASDVRREIGRRAG